MALVLSPELRVFPEPVENGRAAQHVRIAPDLSLHQASRTSVRRFLFGPIGWSDRQVQRSVGPDELEERVQAFGRRFERTKCGDHAAVERLLVNGPVRHLNGLYSRKEVEG